MVVTKGYFCPRIFSQPGMQSWIDAAVQARTEPLSQEMRSMVSDLRNYVGDRFDGTIFEQHPEMQGAVHEVVDYVLSNGDGDLVVQYNRLSWQARLFHEGGLFKGPGGNSAGIQLHLRYLPKVDDPASLNEFFRAVLATDPRFKGNPASLDAQDVTPYFIVTPKGQMKLTVAELVDQASDPEKPSPPTETLMGLLARAKINNMRGNASVWRARRTPDARYFASPVKRCRRLGIDMAYRLCKDGILRGHMDRFSLAINYKGNVIVDGKQLSGLSAEERELVAQSAALWRYAFTVWSDANIATRFMLSLAAQEGKDGELLDIFVLRYPHLYFRFVAPLAQLKANKLSIVKSHSWDKGVVAYHVNRYAPREVLTEGYRIGARSVATTDTFDQMARLGRLIEDVVPRVLQRSVHQSYADLRVEIVRMVLEGKSREEMWSAVDIALGEREKQIDAVANDVRLAYAHALEADDLLDDEMLTMLNHSLDAAVSGARSKMERELQGIIHKAEAGTGVWHSANARGLARMYRISRVPFWEEVKRYIDNDRLFSAFRHDVMAPVLGWKPLEELPHAYRSFMRIARERVLDLYGGRFPERVNSGRTMEHDAPFRQLIENSRLDFNKSYTPFVFLGEVESILELSLHDSVMTPDGLRSVQQAYEDMVRTQLPWRDDAELPEYARPLLRLLRNSVMVNFGGRVPYVNPLTGESLSLGPLRVFVEQGTVKIKKTFTLMRFRELLIATLSFNRSNGELLPAEPPQQFERAFRQFVMGFKKWRPIDQVPAANRDLVAMLRDHVVQHFGGRLLKYNPLTGAHLRVEPIRRLIIEGEAPDSNRYTSRKFYNDLAIVFGLRREGEGYADGGSLPEGFQDAFARVMARKQGWHPLSRVSTGIRPMLAMVRRKVVSVFAGCIPNYFPGTTTQLFSAPFRRFVREGAVRFTSGYTLADFRAELERMLTYELSDDDYSQTGALSTHFPDMFVACAGAALGWRDVDSLPAPRRAIARMFRKHVVELFDGVLPVLHPVTGKNLRNDTLSTLLKEGDVTFDNAGERNIHRMISAVMRLKTTEDGYVLAEEESPEFSGAYEAWVKNKYGWVPLAGIPEGRRALVEMLRDIVSEHFRWRLPDHNPVTGADYGQSPLSRLIATGKVSLNASFTATNFKSALLSVLQLVKEGDVFVLSDELPEGFVDSYAGFIETALRWRPLEELDVQRRELVSRVRKHVIDVYGGQYPRKHPFTGTDLNNTGVDEFVESGALQHDAAYSRERLRLNLISLLMLERDEQGEVVQRSLPEGFDEEFATYFRGDNEWAPLDVSPPHARDLVAFMREHADRFFASALPKYNPLTGRRYDQAQALVLIEGGVFALSSPYGPLHLRDDLVSLYNLERRTDGSIKPGRRSLEKFDKIYRRFAVQELGWRPLSEVEEQTRPLLRVVRRELIRITGGRFPHKHPLHRSWRGKAALRHFAETGEVKLSSRYGLAKFLEDLERFILGVVRTKAGYRLRNLPPYMVALIEDFRLTGTGR